MKKWVMWSPVLLAFIIMLAISLRYQAPLGVDVHYHLSIAGEWARGENGMMGELALGVNKMPYPPLLHWLLVPSVWLKIEIAYTAFVQVLLLPLCVASIMILVWRYFKNEMATVITGLLVLSSYAFIDRAMMVAPQALNMILLPLAFHFYTQRKPAHFTALGMAMVFTHGVVSFACLGGVFLRELFKKRLGLLLGLLLMSSPIVAVTVPYLASGWSRMTGGYENEQEKAFWRDPLFIPKYQRLVALGFPVAIFYVWRGKKAMSELTKISILTILSMSIMFIPWADRFFQYATIPLALLLTSFFYTHVNNPNHRDLWERAVVFLFMLMYATLWLWLITDLYYVEM